MRRRKRVRLSFFYELIVLFGLLFSIACSANDSVAENGDIVNNLILASGLGASIFYEEGHEGTVQFFRSVALSQVITKGLKIITHKKRPNGDCCLSFPSGHASLSFTGAAFIHKRYGWEYGIPAYTAASYVAYTRVETDKHFIEDVIAGAILGTWSSYYFTEAYQGLKVTPVVADRGFSLYVSYVW